MNELESIVQQMVSAGESEENIRIVIENYQSPEVSGNQEAVAEETAGVTAIDQEAVLQENLELADGVLESPRSTTLNKQDGELVFGDQRNLDSQIKDYEQQLSDAVNARGKFEYLKGKTKKERLKLSQKLVAKPSYSESVYNEYKDSYELKPTKDLAKVVSSYLPDDYNMYTTNKEFQNALDQGVNQALINDPVLNIERKAFEAIASEDVNEQMQVISGKYDLTIPEEVNKANAELNNYIRDEIVLPFESSKTFETIKDQYKDITTAVMAERNKEFGRSKDSFLKDDPYAFIEGARKGLIQMNVGLRQADVSTLHGNVADIDKEILELQAGLDDGSLTEESELELQRFKKTGDAPKGSPKQKIDELNKQRDSAIKRIVSNVGTISEKEQRMSLFKESDFDDGITLEEAMFSLGEATPQIVAAGASGLVSGGIGLSLIFAQEYGSNYYTALTEGLVADGIEPTSENMANAIAGGEYADRAEAAAFAVVQASLERVGATGVMKNFTKSIGLGTDFKKATASLFKGEVKQFIKNAPKKLKSMAVSGAGEALTEGGQAVLSQVSIGAQLDEDLRTFLDPEEVKQSMQQGGFIGVMMPFAGKVAGQSSIEARQAARTVSTRFNFKDAESIKVADAFFKESEANIKSKLDANEISQEEYNTELQSLSNARNTGLKIPSNYSVENKEKAFDLILKRDKLQREVEGLDSALSENQKSEIKEINDELNNISNSELVDSRLKKSISFAEKEAGSYGLEVETFEKASDVVAKYGKEAGTADGGVIDGVIFINKEVAKNTKAVNVGSHELLHGILKNALVEGDAPSLVSDFRTMLTTEQNAAIDKRVLAVDEDGNRLYSEEYLKENPDEYLTMFSDAIQDEEISFNESIMTKIGDLIKPILRAVGFKQIEFKTGKDVYNFLREYSNSVKKGELSKGIKKATEGKADMKGSKFSLSASDSAKVNELYSTQGDAALMDVVDLMTPTAKGLTENFRNRPKYSEFKDQLQDEILNGRRGIMEVIMGYPAYVEKQNTKKQSLIKEGKQKEAGKIEIAPLSGYLNNSFSTKTGFKRYIEIADRILGKDEQSKFTQEINSESLNVENDEDIDISNFSDEIGQPTVNALKAAGLSTVESVLDQSIASVVKQTKLDRRVVEDVVEVFKEELDVRSGKKQAKKEDRESLRKKIELTPEVTKKVRDAVAKTFGTKLPDVDSREFKMALQKAFRTELKTTMAKDVMGSRAPYETFLRDNFETIFKVIPQSVMNKRFKAFIEPVLDSNGKQKRENTPQGNPIFKKKTISPAEFIKFFLGREVGGSTKGTRKDALAEALAEEFAFDATMETIQTEDVATKREFLDKGQTTEKVSKKIGRPSTMKFKKSVAVEDINVFLENQSFEKTSNELAAEAKRWRYIAKTIGVNFIDSKKPEDVKKMQDWVLNVLAPRVPKSFFTNGTFANAGVSAAKRNFFFTSGLLKKDGSLGELGVLLKDAVFAKENQNISQAVSRKTYVTGGRYGEVSKAFVKNFETKKFKQEQQQKLDGLKDVFKVFETLMKEDKSNASFIIALLGSTSQGMGHFVRTSAPVKFYAKDVSSGIVEEHTMPASLVAKYLFNSAFAGTLNKDFKGIEKNYFQGALPYADDKKLKGTKLDGKPFNYTEMTPEGWKISDNIWARYFNINVGLTRGGIDPSNIVLSNGKTVYETYSITSTGVSVDAKAKFSRSAANDLDSSLVPSSIKYSKQVTTQTLINALAKTDKSLELARKLDQPVKKIRVFDFDDTLARTKSNVLYTMPNVEGGFSEGSTKLKAIFMVGGPGAGKTNVGKGLQLGRRGYKVVNQDIALEAMKAESGLPAKESDYTAEQRSTRSKLGAAARKAAVAKFDKYAANGDGMVIDGTGASYNATTKKIKALQEKGYEVHMVVANTPLETALERNRARTERSLPDFVVQKTYDQVQESLAKYKEDFGGRLYEINTEAIEYGKPLPGDFLQGVYRGINANKVGKIDAATFAKEAGNMEAEGAQWDFSEFSKVMEGSKGPLLDVAKIIADKRGTKDVFVLTARPADAAGPIKEFLASMGLDIPLANITGLGDGTPQAKAGWIMGKAAEGYNDFYFADDHTGNVKAVKDVLSQIDVKSKVQLAKFSRSATFDTIINDMIEDSSGIEAYKKYSAAKAKTVGASKGKYDFLIPPSAEDFTGLLYKMLGKGKKGDAQMAFLKTNLLDPYNRAELAVTQAKISAANDFVALKRQLKTLPKTLSKQTGIGKFTYSHAVRVAAWTRQGMEVPGLSKRDIKELNDFVSNDSKLNEFTNELIVIQKGKQYPKPGKDWLGGNITTDIIGGINKVNRAEYQQEFRDNIDIIFSKDNMNKMEAAYGTRWREAMEDSIRRMKSGSNKPIGGNRVTEDLLTWLNNSVGAVMFLNTRSALLQTISAVNFINLSDNNIVKAGVAFANQKQFWGDFMTLMNSDYLVERRNGLKINVSESEIADAVKDSKNKPKAAIAFLLSKGFVMTRFADSFAIASGGSTFYRNRLNSLLKSGMDQKAAEAKAFEDFKAIAEENQQSSSPSKISQQQASAAGRVILAWANTPMQYARIQKRAAQDLINGRGDWKTNVSKIVYYGAIQNLIFNTLQQAVFALGFGDDDEDDEKKAEKKNKKALSVANGMIDSQLRGLGIFGAASAAMKNTLMTLYEQHGKKSPKYDEAVADLLSFSPPLGSKISKVRGGFRSFSWNRKEIQSKGYSLDNPAYLAGAQIVTGFTNVPLDRVAKKINNIRGIYSEKSALWQKVALGLGWSTWDVDLGYYGGFDEEVEKKKVSEMTKEEKRQYREQREAERAKIRKQREFERERRRIERNK